MIHIYMVIFFFFSALFFYLISQAQLKDKVPKSHHFRADHTAKAAARYSAWQLIYGPTSHPEQARDVHSGSKYTASWRKSFP